MKHKDIPLHDFAEDDESSIPFKAIPLGTRSHYDASVPHRHNYYEMFIMIKGGGNHEIDFVNYQIADHSIHFVSPGQVHNVKRELDTFGYVILFSRDFHSPVSDNKDLLFELPFLNNNGPAPVLNMKEDEMNLFIPIIELLLKEQEKKSIHQEEILRSYLNIMLMQANRFYTSKNPEALSITNQSLYNRFRILLEKNFTKLHKVKEYAEMLNTTEKTLNEHTKKITGKTASDQIYDRIILEAKRLLNHSDLSTKEIAFFLNYQDPAHFNKFFRTQTGQSPGEFKENNG